MACWNAYTFRQITAISADNPLYLQISHVSADIVVYRQIICKCRYICISVRQIICIGRYAKNLYRSYSRLGSSLNQIQGWTTVRESYSRALEQGPQLNGGEGGRKETNSDWCAEFEWASLNLAFMSMRREMHSCWRQNTTHHVTKGNENCIRHLINIGTSMGSVGSVNVFEYSRNLHYSFQACLSVTL